MTLTVTDFFRQFPTDDACLDHLWNVQFGNEVECQKCEKVGKFYRLRKQLAYSCPRCGHHIHPMVGTPFEKSRTSLQKWFYAMYLFTTSRHGVAAKELQRQLGVTYKTAWRMAHEIRKYMARVDGEWSLDGEVEIDETLIGGEAKGRGRGYRGNKTTVMAMAERDGEIMTRVVPDVKRRTLEPIIRENVMRGSFVYTDDLRSYLRLAQAGFNHKSVNHGRGEYVRGRCHVNSVEGFWSRVKNAIRGTHVHVSAKHLQKYVKEFEYRHNMRKNPNLMFYRLLAAF